MIYFIKAYGILFIITVAFFTGASRYRQLDFSSKIITILTGTGLLSELLGQFFSRKIGNNYPVYNMYNLVEFFLLCIYFNYSIDSFLSKKTLTYYGLFGVLLGILNLLFIQPIFIFNSYFLLFEGFSILSISMYAFYRLLLSNNDLILIKYPHFWFTSFFLVYWTATYLTWPAYSIFTIPIKTEYIDNSIWTLSFLVYLGIAIVLFKSPKKQSLNEQR